MEPRRTYEELALRIQPSGSLGFETHVLRSPYGCPVVPFSTGDLGFPFDQLESCLLSFAQHRHGSHRDLAGIDNGRSTQAITPEAIGDALYRALFRDELRQTFHQCLGRLQARQDLGLRIRLAFDPLESSTRELQALPWELLYRSDTRDFLGRDPLTPIARYLEVPRLTAPLELSSRLRVLVVSASPRDTQPLALESERLLLEGAERADSRLRLTFLPNATVQAIRAKLLEEEFHVFHFMGHGAFDSADGQGYVVLENLWGAADHVSGATLGEVLKAATTLRLVLLNACRTAESRLVDPFKGVASALILAGLSAVIAMRLPISDAAALSFSRRLYEALTAGLPVDAAVAEARMAIYLASPTSFEWATPALFMSIPDGRILLPQGDAPTPEVVPPPSDFRTIGATGGVTIGGKDNTISGGISIKGIEPDEHR